jgi:malonate-semialdehyde dehydrogenase (acetylating)/methylmalonate-semialdehyde dehydrogenase
MTKQVNYIINGRRAAGGSGRTHAVYNPPTGQQSGSVDLARTDEVRAAVAAARAAFPKWADTTPLRRVEILNRFQRIVEDRINDLADGCSSGLLFPPSSESAPFLR